MPPKPKFDANGLRERRHWPSLPEEAQQVFVGFLAYYRAVAEDAALKSAAIAEVADEDLGQRALAQYWAYVVKSIDWLLHQVPKRQKWLEISLAQQEGRWIPPANAPGT